MKNSKGITLIALVITIVVLLILASVSIAMLTGENGLLGKATSAKEVNNREEAREKVALILQEYAILKYTEGTDFETFLEEKKKKQEIDEYEMPESEDSIIWTIELDGYAFDVNEKTLEIVGVGLAGLRPKGNVKMITTGYVAEGTNVEFEIEVTLPEGLTGATVTIEKPEEVTETDNVYSVTENKTYEFEVKATKDGKDYATTVIANINNIIEKPTITVTDIHSTDFTIKVENNYPAEANLQYEYYVGGTVAVKQAGKTYKKEGLTASTSYEVKVRAYIDETKYVESDTTTVETKGLEISYIEDLEAIRTDATTLAGKYVLTRNLDFKSRESYKTQEKYEEYYDEATDTMKKSWTPIGSNSGSTPETVAFTGSFDGQYYRISNLYINATTDYAGLFGYVYSKNNNVIENLMLENVNVSSSRANVGALSGGMYCDNGNYVTVRRVGVTGSVLGTSFYSCFGGLIGSSNGSRWQKNMNIIQECFSKASVQGEGNIGGLIGDFTCVNISDCYATGNVTDTNTTYNGSGGLLGGTYSSSASQNSSMTNSYSIGKVQSGVARYSGGLAGPSYLDGSIENTNCYWNTETSGKTTSFGGTGLTTALMKEQSSYVNWSFSDIWYMDTNGTGYPRLQWEKSIK